MTMLAQIGLLCPCCNTEFSSTTIISINTFGSKSTDLYQRAAGNQSLPFWIHSCPGCGYTGGKSDFENIKIDEKFKESVKEKLTPRVKVEKAFAGRKYEYDALIHKWRGSSDLMVGELYLCAAWCCADDGREDEEKYFRRQVIEYFEKALKTENFSHKEKAIYTYLVGEMHRRIGDIKNAKIWYESVPQVAGDSEETKWIVDLAYQQNTNPKEFFDRE